MNFINSLIRNSFFWIFLAFSVGYFGGCVSQAFAIKNNYERTIKFLNRFGYKEVICK